LAAQQKKNATTAAMNTTIATALNQIDGFVSSATVNGTNLIAGATGNGVKATSIAVKTDLRGNSFTIGGDGVKAINTTAAGLGLSNLGISDTVTAKQVTATIGKALTALDNVKSTLYDGAIQISELQQGYGSSNNNLALFAKDEQSQALAKLITSNPAKPGSALDRFV
jgi:flagellin